jgi:hypothetical protein
MEEVIFSEENLAKGIKTLQGLIEDREKQEEELFEKHGCRRWLIVPEVVFNETKKDKNIKKKDIEENEMTAYIDTIEGKQWVRLYKRLSKLKEEE